MLVLTELKRLKQGDYQKFKTSLSYIVHSKPAGMDDRVRPCLKKIFLIKKLL